MNVNMVERPRERVRERKERKKEMVRPKIG